MQWNGEKNAGFTDGEPWLKLHPNYKEVNVQTDSADPDGVMAFLRTLTSYKKSSDILKDGSFRELYAGKWVYAFERELDGCRLISVCNFSKKDRPLPKGIAGARVLSNYGAAEKLRPYEFLLLEPQEDEK